MVEKQWFKGNLHTHTTESDGDASPEEAVKWYRDHDYDFLVLSDHNHLTVLEYGEADPGKPLMIPGEEVTLHLATNRPGPFPATEIHIIGIGVTRLVEPIDAGSVVATIQANVDAIAEAGGISSLAHPNFRWSYDHREIGQVTGATCVEVFNPHCNSFGGPGKYSMEEIWDRVLTGGRPIWGVAVDDSHHYYDFTTANLNPGRGWIVVHADELAQESIITAMEEGDFYASTGVVLEELEVSEESVSLRVQQSEDWLYTITFTGQGGTVFGQTAGTEGTYRFRGDEGYIRATVTCSDGVKAWTQPVFVR